MRLAGMVCAVALTILASGAAWCAPEPGPDQARQALQRADAAVTVARERRALWTTAEQALAQARDALSRGDYGGAIAAAKRAQAQAQLGLEQTGYTDFTWIIEESP